jgi:cytochrome c-type biogenesis protein CcmH
MRRLKRLRSWPSWAAMFIAVVALLAVGSTRDTGPLNPGDRIDSISRRVACPVCDGESVFESRNPASEAIRAEIRASVYDGTSTDDEILASIANSYGGRVLLVPSSSGFDALIWALPAAGLMIGLVGLWFAFRRWRAEAAALGLPSLDDYSLVEEARQRRRGQEHE